MARKLFISMLVIFILVFTACGYEEQFKYEFSVSRVDMEKVLDEQNLNWFIGVLGTAGCAVCTGNSITVRDYCY